MIPACQVMKIFSRNLTLLRNEIFYIYIAKFNATTNGMINALGQWAILQDNKMNKDL